MAEKGVNASQSSAISGGVVAALWVLTMLIFYGALGGWLGSVVEGQDRSLLPQWPLWISSLALLGSIGMSVVWARSLRRDEDPPPSGIGRRRFLVGTGAVLGGIVGSLAATLGRNRGWMAVTGPALAPETPKMAEHNDPGWAGSRVMNYRRLGRTGFEISDISLGSGRIKGDTGVAVAQLAIDRGVNSFDTAPDYSEAGSETALGKVMKNHRDGMFIATKFCTPQGNLPAGTSVERYVEAVEGSLRRLQTDHVDLVHIHSCDTLERLNDPNAHEAFDRLKQAGKVRFLGFSSHTPNLEQVADSAIESGRFDVMMLAYHHGAWPRLGEIIERAHAKDMGVVAMKTLKGAKHEGLLETRGEQDSYTQAAFKWVLSNPSVAGLVISFFKPANVDEFLHASGKQLTAADRAILDRYDQLIAGQYCRPHCGTCLSSCPEDLPIHDVLRHKMYFQDYGDEREAMRLYGKLEIQADVCTGCSAPCTNACPYGVDIPVATREAHRLLTLS